jgi:hypothetical protein
VIDYFKTLGITALELMPVAQFASEPRLQRLGLSNYWGYNPMAMFALDPRYASEPARALDEFRDAVKALHAAGIEVILDIVLNHSAEIDLEGRPSPCAESITVTIIGSGKTGITTTGPAAAIRSISASRTWWSMPASVCGFGSMSAMSMAFALIGLGDGAHAGISPGCAAV